jgi:rare lipoprotein A
MPSLTSSRWRRRPTSHPLCNFDAHWLGNRNPRFRVQARPHTGTYTQHSETCRVGRICGSCRTIVGKSLSTCPALAQSTPAAPAAGDRPFACCRAGPRGFRARARVLLIVWRMRLAGWMLLPVLIVLTGCAARLRPPTSNIEPRGILQVREGLASYYGRGFDGRPAASGVRFDAGAMVAAHPTYPFGTVVRVRNLKNGRSVDVRIVDRGPTRGPRGDGVIIDLSRAAAEGLGFIRAGRTRVRVEVLRWGG